MPRTVQTTPPPALTGHPHERHGYSHRRTATGARKAHPLWVCWFNMRQRCQRPTHHAFRNYGGRGIAVCPRWETFENFLADMGPTWQAGLWLDRIDNMGDYTPENCRWATPKEQARNRRKALPVDMVALAKATGISFSTLHYRWNHKLSMTSPTPDAERASWFAATVASS